MRVLLVLAVVAALLAIAFGASPVFAGEPSPIPSPVIIDPLDPRAGAGANQVGAPFLALVVVLAIGIATALATGLFVRLARRR